MPGAVCRLLLLLGAKPLTRRVDTNRCDARGASGPPATISLYWRWRAQLLGEGLSHLHRQGRAGRQGQRPRRFSQRSSMGVGSVSSGRPEHPVAGEGLSHHPSSGTRGSTPATAETFQPAQHRGRGAGFFGQTRTLREAVPNTRRVGRHPTRNPEVPQGHPQPPQI